jgi:hypothetical protein
MIQLLVLVWDPDDYASLLDLYRTKKGMVHCLDNLSYQNHTWCEDQSEQSMLLLIQLAQREGYPLPDSLMIDALARNHIRVAELVLRTNHLDQLLFVENWSQYFSDCWQRGGLMGCAWIMDQSQEIRARIECNTYLFRSGSILSPRISLMEIGLADQDTNSLASWHTFLEQIGYQISFAEWWRTDPDHCSMNTIRCVCRLFEQGHSAIASVIWDLEQLYWNMEDCYLIKEAFTSRTSSLFQHLEQAPLDQLDAQVMQEMGCALEWIGNGWLTRGEDPATARLQWWCARYAFAPEQLIQTVRKIKLQVRERALKVTLFDILLEQGDVCGISRAEVQELLQRALAKVPSGGYRVAYTRTYREQSMTDSILEQMCLPGQPLLRDASVFRILSQADTPIASDLITAEDENGKRYLDHQICVRAGSVDGRCCPEIVCFLKETIEIKDLCAVQEILAMHPNAAKELTMLDLVVAESREIQDYLVSFVPTPGYLDQPLSLQGAQIGQIDAWRATHATYLHRLLPEIEFDNDYFVAVIGDVVGLQWYIERVNPDATELAAIYRTIFARMIGDEMSYLSNHRETALMCYLVRADPRIIDLFQEDDPYWAIDHPQLLATVVSLPNVSLPERIQAKIFRHTYAESADLGQCAWVYATLTQYGGRLPDVAITDLRESTPEFIAWILSQYPEAASIGTLFNSINYVCRGSLMSDWKIRAQMQSAIRAGSRADDWEQAIRIHIAPDQQIPDDEPVPKRYAFGINLSIISEESLHGATDYHLTVLSDGYTGVLTNYQAEQADLERIFLNGQLRAKSARSGPC